MTVTFSAVPGFDRFPRAEAKRIIYDELLPACEAKGVHLSDYGNHASPTSLSTVQEYKKNKESQTLFEIEKVQKVFARLSDIVAPVSTYKIASYGFKHTVERKIGEYCANGDVIAAMLLKGYSARFGKRGEPLKVNCDFKAKLLEDPQAKGAKRRRIHL